MTRSFAVALIVVAACNPRNVGPVLCVDSLLRHEDAGQPLPLCSEGDGPRKPCTTLTSGAAILVQHVLPDDVSPYGNEVTITLRSGANEEIRSVPYGELREGRVSRYRARTVFDFPDGGPSLITIHAAILNSELTITGSTGACD
jgi:hypothetical protein